MPDFRALPSVDALMRRPALGALVDRVGRAGALAAAQGAVDHMRQRLARGDAVEHDAVVALIEREAVALAGAVATGSLRPVINATGVVIHTNLGRAPLAAAALARVTAVARGYANLEYDLETGTRGSRAVHAERLLTALTGAEAALVVNNNAAAVFLVLAALARGRDVLISRGELVEIGGGFRVPDVLVQSGARLREVGTTNRTRVSDYTASAGAETALVLRVHPSNFRVEGFTERPGLHELVGAAHAAGLPLVEDLGSGNLDQEMPWEPTVQASIAAGVDVLCVSGDKMLGGPQAGIILGTRALVDRLRKHPLMRALRVDKLTYAALEGTLVEHWAGRAASTVPVLRMLVTPAHAIRDRAESLARTLQGAGWRATVIDGQSAVGGGSAPGVTLPTALVQLAHEGWSADRLERLLRRLDPPVVARIQDDRVVLDLRTVAPDDDATLAAALGTVTEA